MASTISKVLKQILFIFLVIITITIFINTLFMIFAFATLKSPLLVLTQVPALLLLFFLITRFFRKGSSTRRAANRIYFYFLTISFVFCITLGIYTIAYKRYDHLFPILMILPISAVFSAVLIWYLDMLKNRMLKKKRPEGSGLYITGEDVPVPIQKTCAYCKKKILGEEITDLKGNHYCSKMCRYMSS